MSTKRFPAPTNSAELVDRLLVPESSHGLVAVLEEVLGQIAAVPAVLYLWDESAAVYYAAAAFGQEAEIADLPPAEVNGPGRFALTSQGQPVGVLESRAVQVDRTRLRQLAGVLGPILLRTHRREAIDNQLRKAHEQIRLITSAGELLRHLDVEVLLVKILETMLGGARADVGAVLCPTGGPDGTGTLACRVTWGMNDRHVHGIRLAADGRPVAEAVFAGVGTVLVGPHEVETVLDTSESGAHIHGLLALPLTTRDRTLGVVVLANPVEVFGSEQQSIAETLASLAAIALENALLIKATVDRERLLQELAIARQVQNSMYPTAGLAVRDLTVEGSSRPCDETGGDYYSFLERGSSLVAVIGDVSGHGLGAALFTTMAHAILQQRLRASASIESVALAVNDGLYHAQSGRFMTLAVVEVDPHSHLFSYVSCGHNPMLWINQGEIRWLESTGLPVGIATDGEFPAVSPGLLEPGDLLLLYTDGFTEAAAPSSELWGETRLAETTLGLWRAGKGPAEVISGLHAAVDAWSAGKAHSDDLTAVVLVLPQEPGDPK